MAYDFTAEFAHRVGGRWPVSRAQGFVSPAVRPWRTQALAVGSIGSIRASPNS